jgi:hypothetical protein
MHRDQTARVESTARSHPLSGIDIDRRGIVESSTTGYREEGWARQAQ